MKIFSPDNVMTIVYVVIGFIGIYTAYSAMVMKKTKEPTKWLFAEGEIGKCKDKAGLSDALYAKTCVFGVLILLFSVVSLLNKFLWQERLVEGASVAVFVIFAGIYYMSFIKTKDKYMK